MWWLLKWHLVQTVYCIKLPNYNGVLVVYKVATTESSCEDDTGIFGNRSEWLADTY